ncbi:hypothetical protein PR048_010179 [Dryococelus australis]|uniref:Uncharacterized protein n=1 Tax=Dryococelus australis TaxID=614101 RepID=A0ABQ9I1Y7_9NEOP|nr:hypothetical protein PR048_010179 [Dryococelus australis]
MQDDAFDHSTHLGEPGLILGGVAPVFGHVGIVQDDATGRRVFSGISRFPRPCTHLSSPSSALKTSMLTATKISPLEQFCAEMSALPYRRREIHTLPGIHTRDCRQSPRVPTCASRARCVARTLVLSRSVRIASVPSSPPHRASICSPGGPKFDSSLLHHPREFPPLLQANADSIPKCKHYRISFQSEYVGPRNDIRHEPFLTSNGQDSRGTAHRIGTCIEEKWRGFSSDVGMLIR